MTPELLRVVGRYEILRLLGRGGMASVHLARQPALDREVALKQLRSAHVKDAAAAHRFLNESRVAGALNHPSVVSVIEYFEHDGVPFIAMEYLERGSLRPLVGRLSLAQVAGVLDSVLSGLAEAAARGIVHRDLKPENVLVTADGHAKVADFGIAKALGQVCMTEFRTATGQIVGTPAYMAPEQISGGEITPQVDLYATGLVAYELLAGRHPFHGTDAPMALLLCHVNDEPPPLASVRPDLPPGVVAWVHAMLAKDPSARPAGAADAWDRLEGIVADALGPRWRRATTLIDTAGELPAEAEPAPPSERSGIYSVVLPPVLSAPEPPHPEPDVPVVRSHPILASSAPRSSRRRPRRRTVLLALAGALLVAIAAVLYSTAPGEEPRAAARPPAGPPLAQRLREAMTPALRADARVSSELSSLIPGARPDDALDRVGAALAATARSRAAVPGLRVSTADERLLKARARRALSTQTEYLNVVRAALRRPAADDRLDALAARLVSRLELIDPALPGASGSVRGVAPLRRWVAAEIAAAPPAVVASPAPTVAAPAPQAQPSIAPAPAPTATAAPEPTVAPPVSAGESGEQAAPPIRPRRARLRKRLERLAQR